MSGISLWREPVFQEGNGHHALDTVLVSNSRIYIWICDAGIGTRTNHTIKQSITY